MNGHAMVPRDGYMVPLIGIPKAEAEDKCDGCGESFPISELEIQPEGVVCKTCVQKTRVEVGE